ncbi:MAG: DNA methylase N-4/N-6 domain-containing protein [Stygiobacter sp.]|nr:MAG: DNA methylase N-4/N-6 domain-containing protein [Stygiobacter sp.]
MKNARLALRQREAGRTKSVEFRKNLGEMKKTKIYNGDAKEVLKKIGDDSIDLIFTSPPYADSRKNTYGGIHPDKYVEWFLPFSEELFRVLKPTGTFVLNIKEKVVAGERHTYVLDLIKEMRKQNWTEEFIWHKKNSYPGKWPNRFRDAWERLLQFNKEKHFNMYQEEVMVPIGDWAKSRLRKLSDTDKERDNAKNGSGFGKNVSNWINRAKVYPDNVLHMNTQPEPNDKVKKFLSLYEELTHEGFEFTENVVHLATECNNKNHSAAFPNELPEWFIKLFTRENDLVLDPFMGSGTTVIVANQMGRVGVGIEIVEEYYKLADDLLSQNIFAAEPKVKYGKTKTSGRSKLRRK